MLQVFSNGYISRYCIIRQGQLYRQDSLGHSQLRQAWSFVDFQNPSRQLDIIITMDLKDFTIEKVSVGGRKVRVICLRDLMKMKIASGRPQDLVDVESIRIKLNEKVKK